jgi:fused signal recognition particle receptor
VLDATTGQNAIAQAREFSDALGVTDIILTKLDGTAKGGIVVAISRSLGIPISFICTGEKLEDFEVFQAREFVEAIFA